MSASSPAKIASIGLLGTMALVLMMLLSLSSVTDPGAAGHAAHLRENLGRSLADGPQAVQVGSLRRVGDADAGATDGVPGWTHTIRLQPSEAVASDRVAVERLLARAARLLSGRLRRREGAVDRVVCVAELGGGEDHRVEFQITMQAESPKLELVAHAE